MGAFGTSNDEISRLYEEQLRDWTDASARYDELAKVERKYLTMEGAVYTVSFNPARRASAKADVSAAALSARPCFLCRANRPVRQRWLDLEDLDLCVNPFPIVERHFTLPCSVHTPQAIEGRVEQMVSLARRMAGMAVFYNGPRCGASLPDHFHFQAVPAECFPALSPHGTSRLLLRKLSGAVVTMYPDMAVTPVLIEGERIADAASMVMNVLRSDGLGEPMVNIVAWSSGCVDRMMIFPRGAHRPASYSASGEEGTTMFSPGAADVAGCVITVNRRDFDLMVPSTLRTMLDEVALPPERVNKFILDVLSYKI